jgi:hypothetical protein
MTTGTAYVSRYELRVKLVQQVLKDHSELDDKASLDLAEHVVDTLNHIPADS